MKLTTHACDRCGAVDGPTPNDPKIGESIPRGWAMLTLVERGAYRCADLCPSCVDAIDVVLGTKPSTTSPKQH